MRKILVLLAAIFMIASFATTSTYATPDKATGDKKCTDCHKKDKDANSGPKAKGPGGNDKK